VKQLGHYVLVWHSELLTSLHLTIVSTEGVKRSAMTRVFCYIRPHRLEPVKSAIAALGVNGLSVSDVRGTGNSQETTDWLGGDESLIALPIRSRIEVVAPDELTEDIIQAILDNAHTGEDGDGKIFVEKIADAIRIRTQEHGDAAI